MFPGTTSELKINNLLRTRVHNAARLFSKYTQLEMKIEMQDKANDT